jgi:CBS domain-containing protein
MLVAEAMTPHPVTVTPSTTVAKAAAAMRDNDIGDVLVVDRAGHLEGILTDRDIAVRLAADGRKAGAKVKDAYSTDLCTVTVMDGLDAAVELMRSNAMRRLPVVDNDGKPIGIVSLGDAARHLDRQSALAAISQAPPNN